LAGICVFVCYAESAKSRYYGIATVGGADVKLVRSVDGTKMQVEFEDRSGMNVASRLV